MPPLIIAGGIAAAGAIGGGAIAAHGASSAANAQASAADRAAALQAAEAGQALDFSKGQYANSQAELAPFLNAGYGATANLQSLLGIPFGGGSTTAGGSNFSATGSTVPLDSLAKYQGQSFSSLVNSGDPNVSPNQQTTNAWQQAGVPFKTVTTSDGRQVAVRDTTASAPASLDSSGINVPKGPVDLASLVNPNLGSFGSLLKPFEAPTDVTEQNDPGYKFRLQQGQDAIQRSAAASGGLLSTGTAKALDDYSQGQASNEYSSVYNRAFNTFTSNQTNLFNRLAALAGVGQQATNTSINAGQGTANNVSNILLGTGQQIGNDVQAAGNARATGYLNNGNIFGNTISNLSSSLPLLYLLGKNGGSSGDSLFSGGFAPSSIDPNIGAPAGWS